MAWKDLTAKQHKFAHQWCKHRSPSRAYREAYDCENMTPESIAQEADALLKNPKIAPLLDEFVNQQNDHLLIDIKKMLQNWMDIYNVDPNELSSMKIGCCRHCYGEGFGFQWREREYMQAVQDAERNDKPLPDIGGGFGFNHTLKPVPECEECRGEGVSRYVPVDTTQLSPGALLLYGGVKLKKGGELEIIFADRQKALENAGRILGAFQDKLQLDASLSTMAKVVTLTTTDPNEAARVYQEMIAGPMRQK